MIHFSDVRRLARASCILLGALASGLVAAGDSRIELTDGSVISGELVGVEGGRYHIRSATLGDISLPEASVRSLQPLSSASAPSPRGDERSADSGHADHSVDIASIQQRVTSNPDLMQQIFSLQNDPEIKSALSDPEFTRLILAGDVEKLRSDPRFQRLLEHPTIHAIMSQIAP